MSVPTPGPPLEVQCLIQPKENPGTRDWGHIAMVVTFVGGTYVLFFVCTNFTIFAADRIESDIPGMTKVALGTCQSLFWIGWMTAAGLIMPNVDGYGRKKPTFALLLVGVVA